MKTLKAIIACLILAASCIAFVCCSKDKESASSNNSEIVGAWRWSEYINEDYTFEIVWVFKSNGEFTQTSNPDYLGSYGEKEILTGTYKYDGNTLTLSYKEYGEISSETFDVVVSGDSMTVMPNNNESYPMTFHRQ